MREAIYLGSYKTIFVRLQYMKRFLFVFFFGESQKMINTK